MKRLILSVSLAALSGVALAQSAPAVSDQSQIRTRQDEGGTVREPNYNAADARNRRAEGQTASGAPKGERARSSRSGDTSSATPADQTQLRTRQDEGGTVREPNYNAADARNRRAERAGSGASKGERNRGSDMSSSATPADQTRIRTRQDEGGTVREPNYNAADARNRRAERAGSGAAGTSGSGAASTGTTDASSTSGSSTMQRDSTTTMPRSNYPADPVVRGTPGDRPMADRPAGGSSR